MEPTTPAAAPPISLGRWLLVIALPASLIVGGLVWAWRQGVPERDIRAAIHKRDLARVQKMLAGDPTLSRAKVYPQGSEPWRTGRSVSAVEWRGRYLIHDAVEFGLGTAVLDALLAAGADLSVRLEGRPLLHQAARSGEASSAAWLLDHGADLQGRTECNAPCEDQGRSALHDVIASSNAPGKDRVLELLLERGAALEAVDAQGRTPLHLAAESVVTAWLLCRHGALVSARDAQGRTPLAVAAQAEADRPSAGQYGRGATQDWLKPGGGCDELSMLARKRGSAVNEDEGRAVIGPFLCARGIQAGCGQEKKR